MSEPFQDKVENILGWQATEAKPHIRHYWDLGQHTDEWRQVKCGIISASVMKNLVSKKTDRKTGEVSFSVPDTDKNKAYLYELAAQRITNDPGDNFQSYAMQRGVVDEVDAFNLYSLHYEQLRTCGFIVNDRYGFPFGYSPDGLTALHDEGGTEAKSRDPKFQAQTFFENEMPDDFLIQVQTGLLVSERKWIDFISYCGGMPMFVKRVYPDVWIQDQIIAAAIQAERQVQAIVDQIKQNMAAQKSIPTIKRIEDITA